MAAKPKPQTVRNFIKKTLGEASESSVDRMADDAMASTDWRSYIESFKSDVELFTAQAELLKEDQPGITTEEPAAQAEPNGKPEVRWVTVRIPVLDHLPEKGYYRDDRPPRTIGARGPIRLSPSQGRGYASFHLAMRALAETDEPIKVEVSQRCAERVADQPYDVIRHVFGEIARQLKKGGEK